MRRPNQKRTFRLERLEERNLLAGDMMSKVMTEPTAAEPIAKDIDEFLTVLQKEGTMATKDGSLAAANEDAQRDFLVSFFYSVDGSGNNLRNPEWGSAGEELLRLTTAEYGDGMSTPAGQKRASAREVSNVIADQDGSYTNDKEMTDYAWQWGQFVDHDIDLTGGADPAEPFPIPVPTGDPFFDPFFTGTQVIGMDRSVYNPATGTSPDNPRQQLNQITAFIDGSNVYGSDQVRADALREFKGGRLKTSAGDLLPFNVDGLPNAGGTGSSLFLAGDVRANEQVGLTAMHTLFVREHNRIADNFTTVAPSLPDEWVYQLSRSIVIAEMQAITFNEFLPTLVGEDTIPEYHGYDRQLDPGIGNVFSTAAYRFGHSMLSPQLVRLDADGDPHPAGNLRLRDAFFNPQEIQDYGIEPLLTGLGAQKAQEIDNMIVDDVRNFLFGPPGAGGFDLGSLNIQRGRDHGLADYNQVRVDMELEPVTNFSQITSDPEIQLALAATYDTVNDVDAWVGGLAEDHLEGAAFGELVSTVLVDQFTRLRDGDRLWYQRIFHGPFRRLLDSTTLADVIQRNTYLTSMQPNVFYMADAQPVEPVAPTDLPAPDRTAAGGRSVGRNVADKTFIVETSAQRSSDVTQKAAWNPTRETFASRHAEKARAEKHDRIRDAVFSEFGA